MPLFKKYKIFAAVAVMQIIFSHTGGARIFETPAQIAGRYGPLLKHNVQIYLLGVKGIKGDLHEKNGVKIVVVYQHGEAVYLAFEKGSIGQNGVGIGTWDEDSAKVLMEANSAGVPWSKLKTSEMDKFTHFICKKADPNIRQDADITATWTTLPGYPSKIEIETLDFQKNIVDQCRRDQENESKRQLQGF